VGAEITHKRLRSGPEADLGSLPLLPHRRRASESRRRPPTDRRAVVASILAVLALVGCVAAILILATQPTAARLEQEIGSLTHRLTAAQGQLAALQAVVGRTRSQGASLSRDTNHLAGRLTGLQRAVHGLQSSASLAQEQAIGMRDCVPQLQQELTGLIVRSRSVNGRLTSVGLQDPALLSPSCQALFSGL
jgi:hypothetical protein